MHISSSANFLIGLCLVVREGLTIERTIPHPNLYYDTLLLVCKNESVNQMKKMKENGTGSMGNESVAQIA